MNNIYVYILIMAAVTVSVRVLPMTLIKKPIKNRFVQSFLYYVPYVTLAVMTFPAIIDATESTLAGVIALAVGIFVAWRGFSLFKVALCCCASVFVCEMILTYIL